MYRQEFPPISRVLSDQTHPKNQNINITKNIIKSANYKKNFKELKIKTNTT